MEKAGRTTLSVDRETYERLSEVAKSLGVGRATLLRLIFVKGIGLEKVRNYIQRENPNRTEKVS
ncbi:MAG: hypothetical protein DSY42_00585 [Aquifex sp.]|nr:MAG: hypothetical protein DSY42_00585 [Aquifex sp.]